LQSAGSSAKGTYDPARHDAEAHEPLTVAEHLEVLATGEIVARDYRHPVDVDRALRSDATWQQVADARGCDEAEARRDCRTWAKGQHDQWTSKLGGTPAGSA
jgi:hypothetical protein